MTRNFPAPDFGHEPSSTEARSRNERDRVVSSLRWARAAAHDVLNMVTVLQGNLDVAMATIETDHPSRRPLGVASDACGTIGQLTDSWLRISREQMLFATTIDVVALWRETAKLLANLLPSRISLILDIPMHHRGYVHAIQTEMTQVVLNLVMNARDALSDHGGRMSVRVETTSPSPSPEPRPGRVSLTVSDDGIGLSPQARDRVFDLGYSTRATGHGIGLAATKEIVERHGGEIVARSAEGGGAEFVVVLPMVDAN